MGIPPLLPGGRVRLISISASCCLFFPSQKAREDRSWKERSVFTVLRATQPAKQKVFVSDQRCHGSWPASGLLSAWLWEHSPCYFGQPVLPSTTPWLLPWLDILLLPSRAFCCGFLFPRGCCLGALQHFLTSVVCLLWFLWSGMFYCLSCCCHPPAGEHRNKPRALLVLVQSFGAGSEAEFIEIPGILSREIAHGVHLWQESSLFSPAARFLGAFPTARGSRFSTMGLLSLKDKQTGGQMPSCRGKSAQICPNLLLYKPLGFCCGAGAPLLLPSFSRSFFVTSFPRSLREARTSGILTRG